jgi:ribose/xylose/arabinose/galactoside ABC-type transport system permease subunit
MTTRTLARTAVLAIMISTGWVVGLATSASARVAPDPVYILQPTTPAAEDPSVLPYVLVAVIAALATLVATLIVQFIVRRTRVRPAVAGA